MSKLSVAFLVLLLASCSPRHLPKAELRVERKETGGSLNIVPTDVFLDGQLVSHLVGDGVVTSLVPSGVHSLAVQYLNPYSDRGHLRKLEMRVNVTNPVTSISIAPLSNGQDEYSGEWTLKSLGAIPVFTNVGSVHDLP